MQVARFHWMIYIAGGIDSTSQTTKVACRYDHLTSEEHQGACQSHVTLSPTFTSRNFSDGTMQRLRSIAMRVAGSSFPSTRLRATVVTPGEVEVGRWPATAVGSPEPDIPSGPRAGPPRPDLFDEHASDAATRIRTHACKGRGHTGSSSMKLVVLPVASWLVPRPLPVFVPFLVPNYRV